MARTAVEEAREWIAELKSIAHLYNDAQRIIVALICGAGHENGEYWHATIPAMKNKLVAGVERLRQLDSNAMRIVIGLSNESMTDEVSDTWSFILGMHMGMPRLMSDLESCVSTFSGETGSVQA